MPELPEVETTRRGIAPYLENRRIRQVDIYQPTLRWPIPDSLDEQLTDRLVKAVRRRGKYLLVEFVHGTMLMHLGMSGSLRISDSHTPRKKHDHVVIHLADNKQLRFHDPRRFGAVLWTEDSANHPLLVNLGPEPLSDDFSWEYLYQQTRKRKKDIKSLIMDSQIVVGVGNIYAAESLFMASIRPTKAAGRVTKKQAQDLTAAIKEILHHAIKQGGTTLRDFVNGKGEPGYFAQKLKVYGRGGEICEQCQKPLKVIQQAQRSTVYCPKCQH